MRIVAVLVVSLTLATAARADETCTSDGWCTVYTVPPGERAFVDPIWGSGPNQIFVGGGHGIVRFDGSRWAPAPGDRGTWIIQIGGTGPNDVFAVGGNRTVEHWDGTTWRVEMTDPHVTARAGALTELYVLAPGDVWAIDSRNWHRRADGEWQPVRAGPPALRGTPISDPTRPRDCRVGTDLDLQFTVGPSPTERVVSCVRDQTYRVRVDGTWITLPPVGVRGERPLFGFVRDGTDVYVSLESGVMRHFSQGVWHVEQLGAGRHPARLWSDGTWLYATAYDRIVRRRL